MQTNPAEILKVKLNSFLERAPKLAGNYVVNHFKDNIRKRGGVPVNGGLNRFEERSIKEPGKSRKTLLKSGNMVDSIRITGLYKTWVTVGIDQPSIRKYALMHQKGGSIAVTPKMKKFFWAMFYKASGSVKTTKTGNASKSKKNLQYNSYAQAWKAMALMKIGAKIKIKKREFMRLTPDIEKGISREFQYEINKIIKQVKES